MSKASLELGGGNWAAKDGNLLGYAVGDTSGKYLPREFTFSRGADIGATRVNKDGLIEKYRENLLLQSNQFDTTWTKNSASLTSGQAGYDGSNNAWELKATGDGVTNLARVNQGSLSVSGVSTFSVYAKAGNVNWMRCIALTSGVNVSSFFDLGGSASAGSSTSAAVLDSSITSVGNGWYRISMTGDGADSIYEVRIQVAEADGDDIPATNSYIYVQNAQLEYGLVATDYLESDDETGKAGVLDNLPRIDYTSGSAQLLMEPSRTNLLDHSEYFADVYFGKFNVDVDASDTLSPEGKSNSYKVTETTSTSQHAINVSNRPTLTAGSHTHSCFVKANGVNDIVFYNNGTSGAAGVNFDLSSESYSNLVNSATDASIESYGNGWYRISMTFTAVVGTTGPTIYLRTLSSYAGDGVSGIYVYGMQTEAGSYATSYIPTYGASDTRAQDQADFDQDVATGAWTIYMDVENLTVDSGSYTGNFFFKSFVSPSDSAFFFNQTCFGWPNTSSGQSYSCGKLGVSGTEFTGKWAATYDGVNTIKIYVDGSLEETVTDVDPNRASGISSGMLQYNGDHEPRKIINNLKIYNKELSQSEAEALTA